MTAPSKWRTNRFLAWNHYTNGGSRVCPCLDTEGLLFRVSEMEEADPKKARCDRCLEIHRLELSLRALLEEDYAESG